METLLIAATEPETTLIREALDMQPIDGQRWKSQIGEMKVSLLVTGIGMVSTAYSLGKYLAQHKPDFAINFGIAGSFDPELELTQVVEIVEDSFSELGAEDRENWISLEQMGFAQFERGGKSYFNTFKNPTPSVLPLQKVSAITVNQVHGQESTIEKTRNRWGKQLETMEGAAFFHAIIQEGIPGFALRAISNYVEARDRSRWQIGPAIKNVQEYMLEQILRPSRSDFF